MIREKLRIKAVDLNEVLVELLTLTLLPRLLEALLAACKKRPGQNVRRLVNGPFVDLQELSIGLGREVAAE